MKSRAEKGGNVNKRKKEEVKIKAKGAKIKKTMAHEE
jgi:hypothetical protein